MNIENALFQHNYPTNQVKTIVCRVKYFFGCIFESNISYYSLNDLNDMKKLATDLHRRTQTQNTFFLVCEQSVKVCG